MFGSYKKGCTFALPIRTHSKEWPRREKQISRVLSGDKFIETKETKGSESLEDTKFHSIYTLITL